VKFSDDSRNFIKRADIQQLSEEGLKQAKQAQLDRKEVINAMVIDRSRQYRQVPQRRADVSRGLPQEAPEGSVGKLYLIQRDGRYRRRNSTKYSSILLLIGWIESGTDMPNIPQNSMPNNSQSDKSD